MRRLFLLICALLAYGSLYPWHFRPIFGFWYAVAHVFHAWPPVLTFDILKDMALNVVVYSPLGLTGYLSSARGFRWTRALWPIAFGFLFSLSVETLQSFLPGRVPSGMDLLCNTLGAAAGVAIAAGYESVLTRWLGRLQRGRLRPSSALMMLIIMAGRYLMPLSSNAIKLMTVYHQPELMQAWSWTEFANTAVTWLLAARFAEAILRKPAFRGMCVALALAALTYAISPNLLFTRPMLAGAVVGVLISKLLAGRDVELAFAALTAAWLIGDGLRPYQFTDHKNFEWIPFLGMLGYDWTSGVQSLLTKAWMYGATFWTWERAGMTRARAVAALLVLLAAIEFAQKFLPGRVSTMTDLAMGAITAGLLWAVERKYGA
ncbi:MAG TPA: VanZ family protein [Bryobacteraceae bacterium]|jgi:VanZ family protein